MVHLVGIAAARPVECAFGQAGFDIHDRLGFGCGLGGRVAEQLKHLLHVLYVLLAQIHGLGIIFQVIITVGHSHATLVCLGNDLTSVFKVLVRTEAE